MKTPVKLGLEQYNRDLKPDGYFTQYQNWTLLVFIYQTWEDNIRPQLAKLYGVNIKQVCCHLMGDLRHVRNDIIHRRGKIDTDQCLPFLSQIWAVDGNEWKFSDDDMRSLVGQLSALQVFVSDP